MIAGISFANVRTGKPLSDSTSKPYFSDVFVVLYRYITANLGTVTALVPFREFDSVSERFR